MNYYVYINGKEHRLVQGFTISEEYNETLDSATITLSNSEQLDLNPYDDVFIYGEWCGYYDESKKCIQPVEGAKFNFIGYPVNFINYGTKNMPAFYKHYLIDQFNENILILDDNPDKIRYSYTIDLFSETKGLETVQAPNVSVTQPLSSKVSTMTYVGRFLELYNKKLKKSSSGVNNWHFSNKYSIATGNEICYPSFGDITYYEENQSFSGGLYIIKGITGNPQGGHFVQPFVPLKQGEATFYFDNDFDNSSFSYEYIRKVNGNVYLDSNENDSFLLETLDSVFEKSYCPDFTLNNPSLRQILDKLLITKDRITVVKDDKIYAMDISKRRGYFDLNQGEINYISGSKASGNFCNFLKRTYTDGLSQNNTGRYVEYLGFRNSDDALLSLSNMRVEASFPIYKVNKIYMCYYKKYRLFDSTNNRTYDNIFLCKQNITPLVKLNSERNVLSEDIRYFNEHVPQSIEELSKYKLATLGYDIGSKYIEGWGTEYSYPESFLWQTQLKTYLETIFYFVNKINPTGIYDYDFLVKKTLNIGEESEININWSIQFFNEPVDIPIPQYDSFDENYWEMIVDWFQGRGDSINSALHMKHIFFEMDYTPFFEGTIIQSKGLVKGSVTINDNQSSSLSLLETDGLAQKEKINRYGNKGIQINARYTLPSQIQGLGSVYEKNLDKDIVIFHKEYSLNDNVINCTYYGSKDYVLKDYFTSVYAKHRTYNLMSYGESILRSDNEHFFILLSKGKKYIDNSLNNVFSNFETSFSKQFLSFWDSSYTTIKYLGEVSNENKINYGYFKKDDKYYAADSNVFVSGTSFCLNICMRDNVTVGNYISEMHNEYVNAKKNNYMMGATQDFAWLTDEADGAYGGTTGLLTNLGFYFGHVGEGQGIIREDVVYSQSSFPADNIYKGKLFKLPIIAEQPENITNVIGFNKNVYKDNKERLDMTIQFELVNDEEVYLSQWLPKLSDLFGVNSKFNYPIPYSFEINEEQKALKCCSGNLKDGYFGTRDMVFFIVDSSEEGWQQYFQSEKLHLETNFIFIRDNNLIEYGHDYIINMEIKLSKINSFNSGSNEANILGVFTGVKLIGYSLNNSGSEGSFIFEKDINFKIFNTQNFKTHNPDATNEVVPDMRRKILSEAGFSNDSKYLIFYYEIPQTLNVQGDSLEMAMKPESGGTSGSKDLMEIGTYDYYFKLQSQNMEFVLIRNIEKTYPKNLYWVYTPADYDFREYMVYDELDNLNGFTILNPIGPMDPPNPPSIQITWINDNEIEFIHPRLDYGSHILCYYVADDGKYNFVFGFKPDEYNHSGKTSQFTVIHVSVLSFNDLTVYDENTNLPIGEVPNEVEEE